ncbi:DNA-directed RNA polymerase subunit beta' [Candidatus Falkowbacteria bacterium]|nr:DNA-directed RNA polymerase subunit beta' [Candidatus Falkowbacteria bacterium]
MYKITANNDFDAIRLKIASPDDIHGWSHGEVLRPETINYRTQKPEKDGLFCEKIFGPSKDWECYCGKYKKIRYKGIVCDKCGVEVTRALVRRERMGHIDLAAPVSHIWFLRGVPSKIGLILNLSPQTLEKIIYFANFIITRVDENIKTELLEQLKKEFKDSKKELEDKLERDSAQAKQDLNGKAEKVIDGKIKELNVQLAKDMLELESEFEYTEKEIRDLKKLQIISEHDYQEMSLKYGPLFDAEIGAEAVYHLLREIDLEQLTSALEAEQEKAQGAKKEKLIKRVKLLRSLQKNNIRPEWLIMTSVPVIPPDLRPMVALDGGRFATSDLNDLYRRVINRNNRLKRLNELNAPEVIIRNEKRMLQEAVDALIDNSARHSKTVIASTGQKRQLKSLADILKGKQGRFRQNLLGKRTDYSGRSVIVVGPELKLYQCGLPKKMALELFKPHIISHLIKDGYVHNIRSANRFIESERPEVWDILEKVTKGAHVLLNRAPTLHRLGIQAFQPILIEGKAIRLHPLVCSAFNADFDGDQMAVHVPLTEEAKHEAAHIMLATNNLLKPATGKPIAEPKKDMILGIHYLTTIDQAFTENEKPQKSFSSVKEAKSAYQLRYIKLRQPILIKDKFKSKKEEVLTTTIGRVIFNSIVPEKLPYYNENIDGKTISKIASLVLETHLPEVTIEFLDKIKRLGFKYLTKSGYSWGMHDLPMLDEKKELIDEGDTIVDEIEEQYLQGLLTERERHSKIIETWTEVKDKIVELSTKKLSSHGPVYAMITSGARGSWGQLTQMVGMKGLVSNPVGDIIELPVKGNFKSGFDVLEYFISSHGSRKGLSDTALRTANAGYLTRRLVDVVQDVVIKVHDCGDTQGVLITQQESKDMGETIAERIRGRYSLQQVKGARGKVIVKTGELITDDAAREIEKLDLDAVNVRSVLTCALRKGLCQKCYGFDLGYNQLVNMGTAVGIIAAQSIGEPGTQLTMRTFHTGGVAGKDITQGLPRVEELFEARPPKHRAFVAEADGSISIDETPRTVTDPSGKVVLSGKFGQKIVKINYHDVEEDEYKFTKKAELKVKDNDSVSKGSLLFIDTDDKKVMARRDGIVKVDKNKVRVVTAAPKTQEYIIPREYSLVVKNNDLVTKGDRLTDGSMDLQSLYRHKGKVAVQKYMLKEIQHIYSSQGQKLNDKHVEIILRQLFARVYIRDAGDTELLPGEIADKTEVLEANDEVKGKTPAVFDELFLGVSKISLSTPSWLSAASFQETARVLINAAVTGKIDYLEGLKENVIIGRRIPAGTGFRPEREQEVRDSKK